MSKHQKKYRLLCVLAFCCAFCVAMGQQTVMAVRQAAFPSGEQGISQGVSAAFAGAIGKSLVLAGGCNFPDAPAADGGKKKFYRGVYVAPLCNGSISEWQQVAQLPQSAAYGVAVEWHNSLILVGGCHEGGALTTAYRLTLNKKGVQLQPLPELPYAMDNMAGCVVENRLYVVGGNQDGVAGNGALCLDLKHPQRGWRRLPNFPGSPRVQPILGSTARGTIALLGGFSPKTATSPALIPEGGWSFSERDRRWEKICIPDTFPGWAAGGSAVQLSKNAFLALGGVNREVFLQALNAPSPDYMRHSADWYRFHAQLVLHQRYGELSSSRGKSSAPHHVSLLATSPVAARAGAAVVRVGQHLFLLGGELKPGVRTPDIYRLTLEKSWLR